MDLLPGKVRRKQVIKIMPADVLWQASPSIVLALDRLGVPFFATVIAMAFWSHFGKFPYWLAVALSLAWLYGGAKWLAKAIQLKCVKYTLTHERLLVRAGVFNRETDELELFRVRDFQIDEPFFLRVWALGNITLLTSDRTHPTLTLEGIPDLERLNTLIREQVKKCWINRGVYEVDAG